MAVNINASTSSGIGITSDNSGVIQFQSNASNTAIIDASGNVGIGTTTPNQNSFWGKSVTLNGAAGQNAAYELRFNGTLTGYLSYSTVDNSFNVYNYSNSSIRFGTNNIERMQIDSSGNLLFNSGYGSVATAYGCRAWITFNGSTASPTINGSGNITSITDNGTADYTLNFTNSFPDTNYSFVGFGRWYNDSFAGILVSARNTSTKTSSACRIIGSNSSTGNVAASDPTEINVMFFR